MTDELKEAIREFLIDGRNCCLDANDVHEFGMKYYYRKAMEEVRAESVKYFGGIAISHQWFPLAGWLDLLDAKQKEQP